MKIWENCIFFPPSDTAQLAQSVLSSSLVHPAWCTQLAGTGSTFATLHCMQKGPGHIPKYPNALWRVVGLENSMCTEKLPVWGISSTFMYSRNRML